MRYFVLLLLSCLIVGLGAQRSVDCNSIELTYVVRSCQALVLKDLQKNGGPPSNCPASYDKGLECFNKAMGRCTSHAAERKAKQIVKTELEYFGDEDLFCQFGGLRSIVPIIANFTTHQRLCRPAVNVTMVREYEQPFYTEFRKNVSSSRLCDLYEKAHTHQARLLASCHSNFAEIGYENPSFASSLDPFCGNIADRLDEERVKILDGESHPTSSNVIIPVIVVCSLLFVAVVVGLCWMAKREPKTTQKTGVNQQQKQVRSDEPESVPMTSIATSDDQQITSA